MSQGLGQIRGQSTGRLGDYTINRQLPEVFVPNHSNTLSKEEEILPYMARVHSPVRVTFSPTISMKRKSRISNQTMTAMFNFRPIKRGDRLNLVRFKPPDSTLPSLQYLSPWISVTKGDYRDPREPLDGEESLFENSRSSIGLQRNAVDIGHFDMQDNVPTITNCSRSSKANTLTDCESPSRLDSRITREASAKTQSSDKRVTFSDTPGSRKNNGLSEQRTLESPTKDERANHISSTELEIDGLPDKMDFYSGYLPSELSEKIASEVNSGFSCSEKSTSSKKERPVLLKDGHYYKPLIGDRSLFMRESYPTKPIIYQSDIDKLRFEGHQRLMKSAGQAPAHFSMFKGRGSLIQPKNKGMYLEEALKRQQRLSKSADNSSMRRQKSSIEIFEGQRDRTYAVQQRAREIINKS